MEANESLRSIVSALSGVPPEELRPTMVLDQIKLRGSIKRARLDAELRKRFKSPFPTVYTAKTYADLETAVLGRSAPAAPPAIPRPAGRAPSPPTPANSDLSCGIDLEMAENLPETLDFWEDAFYSTHFTPAEIAFCSLQSNPRLHFTARWAVKEALQKCDGSFINVEMSQIEPALGITGQPSLVWLGPDGPQPLPHAVIVSQSDTFAAAIVARLPANADRAAIMAGMAGQLAVAISGARTA